MHIFNAHKELLAYSVTSNHHLLYLNCNTQSVTTTASLVYLGMSILAEIHLSHFQPFNESWSPGGKSKSQNDPVIVGHLLGYNCL